MESTTCTTENTKPDAADSSEPNNRRKQTHYRRETLTYSGVYELYAHRPFRGHKDAVLFRAFWELFQTAALYFGIDETNACYLPHQDILEFSSSSEFNLQETSLNYRETLLETK
jgi:hypothetical protein